jgi:hypothetical protein
MQDNLPTVERAQGRLALTQVVFRRADDAHLGAELIEQRGRRLPEESRAAGDDDPLAGPEPGIWGCRGHPPEG